MAIHAADNGRQDGRSEVFFFKMSRVFDYFFGTARAVA
jgi:hypothetical protein